MSYFGYIVMIPWQLRPDVTSAAVAIAARHAGCEVLILRFKDFVDSDVRERRKSYLACAIDAPRASDTRKGSQLADALDY